MSETKEISKRPLGRGLGSLFGDDVIDNFRTAALGPIPNSKKVEAANTNINVSDSDGILETQRIWQVEIEKLSANLYQPRKVFAPDKLQELVASIKEKGVLQPIMARRVGKDHFEIIAGERRWRAAQVVGLARVPVILKEVKNQESLELALIENLQRHDLNPIDEAEAYQRLADEFELTQQEISQKVGKDRVTVANFLRLLTLCPEVRLMLAQGELSTGHAKALLALTDPVKQKEVAKKITSEKLTVRAAEKLVQGATRKAQSHPALQVDVAGKLVKGLESDLAKTLGTKVEITYNKGHGNISIKFLHNRKKLF